ncbi:hypothetical protein KIPB_007208 [Kipferlia bialata]|uniref:Nop domain-containing protein n=1 Tax=Kipferlia bialata TaxID=797122 RepID=A0A9K3GIW1_9EUKA|nr:hypothetical protein KIPB_007208 [Kipferlia bialata]|eukprot:g7208.t1
MSQARPRDRGRLSRILASKASIAARFDCFRPTDSAPSVALGEALAKQVEDRLTFFKTGDAPMRNRDAMAGIADALAPPAAPEAEPEAEADVDMEAPKKEKKEKKSKKSKDKKKKKKSKKSE